MNPVRIIRPLLPRKWTYRHKSDFSVNFDNIFSDTNKKRCMPLLLESEPARSFKHVERNDGRLAAVLVPLCTANGQAAVLFTLRSSKLAGHRGQICFPGGKVDKTDPDMIHTALREAKEELGMNSSSIDIWGHLRPVPAVTGIHSVTGIVAYCGNVDINQLTVSRNEVEDVFTYPLASLCSPEVARFTTFRSGKHGYTLPVYVTKDHQIWGLTAIMLHMTLTALCAGLYTNKLYHKAWIPKQRKWTIKY